MEQPGSQLDLRSYVKLDMAKAAFHGANEPGVIFMVAGWKNIRVRTFNAPLKSQCENPMPGFAI
jgi:hypothetical protein